MQRRLQGNCRDTCRGCNIRTMTCSVSKCPPKHMEAQGFVSKNVQLEKVHPQWLPSRLSGNMIRYPTPCDPVSSLVRHFLAH
jgi:hypothetical protein